MSTVLDSLHAVIGRPHSRIDGPLKVSGEATYTSDVDLPGLLHAVPVSSTIASGKLVSSNSPPLNPCPACTRFCIAATLAASTGSPAIQSIPVMWTRRVHRSKTTSFAITASTLRWS